MIDERHEELAALYALDLLEGAERTTFEAEVARDPALAQLVDELRNAGATFAHVAPAATPPDSLRVRVLASVANLPADGASTDNIVRPPAALFRTVLPWVVAACFALSAAWLGQLYLATRAETQLLRDGNALVEISLKSTQQQLEAERILSRRQIADGEQRVAETREQLIQRDTQVAGLTQRIDTLTSTTTDLDRQLGAFRQRVAALTAQLQRESDLANLKITALASLLKDNPQALAVAVWNPEKQEGVLQVEKLPALAAGKDYQLWVVDPQYADPVDGGTFTVDPESGARRIQFKSKQPIKNIAAYAITQETKGGVVKSAGPFLLLGK
jgi:anti-sigma-K factor RskA